MNVRMRVIALAAALFAVSSSFAGTTPPKALAPSVEENSVGKQFGKAMARFKELAGHPVMAGMCDKKGEVFATQVVLWSINGINLFEIENSSKKFYYISEGAQSRGFFEEIKSEFKEIPLAQIPDVLRASGASEFLKSIDPPTQNNSDCVAKKLEPGITDK